MDGYRSEVNKRYNGLEKINLLNLEKQKKRIAGGLFAIKII